MQERCPNNNNNNGDSQKRECVGGEGGEFSKRSKMRGDRGPSLMNLYAETAMIWH
ncbi:hypothetical protein M5D96_002540, partial [Drosophila gunungcola]